MASAGRVTQASNASQSLAGIVTMTRLSTSISADFNALRRTKSLRLVRDCSAAASRMARSAALTRTLRTDVVDDKTDMRMTMAYRWPGATGSPEIVRFFKPLDLGTKLLILALFAVPRQNGNDRA